MEDLLKDLLKSIESFGECLYQISNICLMHPEDLLQINMDEFPDTCFFISDHHMEKGKAFIVKDSELKRMLYEFCTEHPERVFRGRKR